VEQFFAPIRRFEETWEVSDGDEGLIPFDFMKEFLIHRWNWEDLCAFISDGDGHGDVLSIIIWITEDSFLPFDCDFQTIQDYGYGYALMLHAYSAALSVRSRRTTVWIRAGCPLASALSRTTCRLRTIGPVIACLTFSQIKRLYDENER
jgi:hypothetical protein